MQGTTRSTSRSSFHASSGGAGTSKEFSIRTGAIYPCRV
jgi:hypothetical protein